jgi:hypothetical protein
MWLNSRLHVSQYMIKTLEDGLKSVDDVRTPLQQVNCVTLFILSFLCHGCAQEEQDKVCFIYDR